MFCKKCGHQLENENASYCSNCGAPVKGTAVSSTESFVKGKMQAVSNLDSRKKVFITLAIVAVIIIFAAIKSSLKSDEERIVGTWEELSYTGNNRTYTYEEGEGDKVTFCKDGKIIDGDNFLGYEFGWMSPVDVLSWDIEDETLIFYIEYGNVAYVPYKLSGKKLTLYFGDEITAELYKIK